MTSTQRIVASHSISGDFCYLKLPTAMARMRLTAAAVERLKPPKTGQKEYFDELLPSFGVRVSYSGAKAWFVMTRANGKLMRFTLGRHPAVSLSAARAKARDTIAAANAGLDPRRLEEQRRDLHDAEARNTFGLLAEEFMTKHVRQHLRPSTAREYERILFGADTKAWRPRPISSIQKRDVLELLERVDTRGSKSASSLSLAYLRKFFNWCADREAIAFAPTVRMKRVPLRARDRVLKEDELRLILKAFDHEGGLFGPLFKLLLLTGQRRGEVAGLRWDELRDLQTSDALWKIPGNRTKNHLAHHVPLSPQAVAIIVATPPIGPFVFSSTGDTPVSGFSKAKARIDQWLAQQVAELGTREIAPWSLHDLRRTMVTMANDRLSVAPHIVEAMVNHVSGASKAGVAGIYNRAQYSAERRVLACRWADYISQLSAN